MKGCRVWAGQRLSAQRDQLLAGEVRQKTHNMQSVGLGTYPSPSLWMRGCRQEYLSPGATPGGRIQLSTAMAIMQHSMLGRTMVPAQPVRPACVRAPVRITALAQPFVGRPRSGAAPKVGSLQITQAVALREVDTVQKLEDSTEDLAINAIRFLAIDGVNAANSGHPGLPMGCALRIIATLDMHVACPGRGGSR